MQKLYCYVDESGQDSTSNHFVVVAVVSVQDQEIVREKLDDIEDIAKTNKLKWHKTRNDRRMRYLALALERRIASGDVYSARYHKPIPYFFPLVDLIEKAIKEAAREPYRANVYIDGIDKRKARALTNALRASGISLRLVKSRRDESEPLIRLADMWAGCIRSALLKHKDAQAIVKRAKAEGYLIELTS
jgi:hypothetical protein